MASLYFCIQVGIEAGVLVSATRHKPAYGARMYELRSGAGRKVDLLPYRRFFAALVLQQVLQRVALKGTQSQLLSTMRVVK